MITRDSFEEAVSPFYSEMSSLATKWCYGDIHKAEDSMQEALLKAYLHLTDFDGRNFKQWVITILKNTISISNRPKKHGWGWKAGSNYIEQPIDDEFPLASHEPQPLHQLYYKEANDVVEKFLKSLAPIDYQIIQDAVEGIPQLDTAHRLNITRVNATKRLHRIREQLREQLREHN